LPPETIEQCLQAGLDQGILRPVEGGFAFSHRLLRDALLEELTPPHRVDLFRNVAEAAVPLLLQQGKSALKRGAKTAATRLLERALVLACEDTPQRGKLLLLQAICIEPHQ